MSIASDQEREQRDSANSVPLSSPTEAYVNWLREEPDSGRWNSDPTQPCLLYKVYRDVEQIPLDARPPLRLGSSREALLYDAPVPLDATPDQTLAWMLYYTHGLTRFIRPAPGSLPSIPVSGNRALPSSPVTITGPVPHAHPILSRPVPSGGSLHPVEIYLALGAQWNIPPGIYHYDSLHHALDLLRSGDYLAELAAILPKGNDMLSCSAALLPAVFFQKNHQKYTNISYRLQTLDSGIVIEQLRFMAHRFGLKGSLYLQFLDRPLHHLIGLDMQEECVYAVLSLKRSTFRSGSPRTIDAPGVAIPGKAVRSSHTISDYPPITVTHAQPFKPLPRSALLESLHSSSLLETLPERTVAPPFLEEADAGASEEDNHATGWFPLPRANFVDDVDLASTLLHRRRTGFNAIDPCPIQPVDLGTVLYCTRGVYNHVWHVCHCQLYCVISRVTGIPAGVYRYNLTDHALMRVHSPDLFSLLARLSTSPNINPQLAPVNIFFTGNYAQAYHHFGERGFRTMGIEIGRPIQRILLAAAANNLAVHTHLSYKFEVAGEKLLRLPLATQLPLVSLMLGKLRNSQGGLLETIWY